MMSLSRLVGVFCFNATKEKDEIEPTRLIIVSYDTTKKHK
jgi:hypothetical protein